jgi:mannitol-1-/sugar-/sorbitol-6-/2-deoxyglucose-6-phosphatase
VTVAAAPFGASIFDMDGLLIDSENLWLEVEVEILGPLGVPLEAAASRQTKGMFVNEVIHFWHERYPWRGPTPDEVAVTVVDRVCEVVRARGTLMPGVDRAIALCQDHGLALGLASSSQYKMIHLVLEHFGLDKTFSVVHSAEDEQYGKPNPAVYLSCAAKLGVRPERCLAWEDAPAGVLAAKAARMACVAVPEPQERHNGAFAIADAVLDSLESVDEALWDRLVATRSQPGVGGDPTPETAPAP